MIALVPKVVGSNGTGLVTKIAVLIGIPLLPLTGNELTAYVYPNVAPAAVVKVAVVEAPVWREFPAGSWIADVAVTVTGVLAGYVPYGVRITSCCVLVPYRFVKLTEAGAMALPPAMSWMLPPEPAETVSGFSGLLK